MTVILSYNGNDTTDKEFETEINNTFQDTLEYAIEMLKGNIPVNDTVIPALQFLKSSLCDCKVNEMLDTSEYFCDVYDEGLQD